MSRRSIARQAQRAQAKAAAIKNLKTAKAGFAQETEKRPLLVWLRSSGAASIGIGLLGLTQDPRLFWFAIGAFYFGMLIIAIDLIKEKISKFVKCTAVIMWLIICAVIGAQLVYVNTPLQIIIGLTQNGLVFTKNDIKWKKGYSELTLRITNNSDRNYDDVVLFIKPELLVVDASIIGSNCSGPFLNVASQFTMASPKDMSSQNMSSGISEGLVATGGGYKFRCDRLPRNGGYVEIAMAVVGDKKQIQEKATAAFRQAPGKKGWVVPMIIDHDYLYIWGDKDADIFGDFPTKIQYVEINGSYIAAQRINKVSGRRDVPRGDVTNVLIH